MAATRIDAIDAPVFRDRMRIDPVFNRVVLRVVDFVCEANPFTGERNPGCSSALSLTQQQLDLRREELAESKQTAAGEKRALPHDEEWLKRLESATGARRGWRGAGPTAR